jgi:hypothetical protein
MWGKMAFMEDFLFVFHQYLTAKFWPRAKHAILNSCMLLSQPTTRSWMYEEESKIFQTGVAIYTAVVVARSIGPNMSNSNFRVLPRGFAATEWKLAKTSPRTLARTDLVASPWQRPVSHFCPHPAGSGEIQNECHSPLTVLPWFGTRDIFFFQK